MRRIYLLDDIPKDIQILNQKNSQVFALNFEVEKYLRSKNIIPINVNEWINWEDFMLIDTIAMEIPMKWGFIKHIEREIEFKKINLSLLIEKELFLSLLPIIHKIILVDRIIENTNPEIAVIDEKNNTYFGKILKNILKTNKIKTENIENKKLLMKDLKVIKFYLE